MNSHQCPTEVALQCYKMSFSNSNSVNKIAADVAIIVEII